MMVEGGELSDGKIASTFNPAAKEIAGGKFGMHAKA